MKNPVFKSLCQIDFLVFSSHKTATQTVLHSLRKSGLRVLHCHGPENLGLKKGEFSDFLRFYKEQRGGKLTVISIFRLPLERMISSFFQWHGVGEVRTESGIDIEASLINGASIKMLQKAFEVYCQTIDGFGESIDKLCDELQIDVGRLRFFEDRMQGHFECDLCAIHLLRFDQLIENFTLLLGRICLSEIIQHNDNIGQDKWYAAQYARFKNSARFSSRQIEEIFYSRRHLVDLFYPGGFEDLLRSDIRKFGS